MTSDAVSTDSAGTGHELSHADGAEPARPQRRAAPPDAVAERSRALSEWLCARATADRAWSTTLRGLATDQQASWRRWHRMWRHLWEPNASGEGASVVNPPHPLLRVCMYCWCVHEAVPAGSDEHERPHVDGAGAAWCVVPWWVRDQLREGGSGLRVSHGVCPDCARAHGLVSDEDHTADAPRPVVPADPARPPASAGPSAAARPFLPPPPQMAADALPPDPTGAPAMSPTPPERRQVLEASAVAIERAHAVGGTLRRVADGLVTPEELAVQIVDAALEEFGAEVAVAARLVDDGATLEVIGATHPGLETLAGGPRLAIGDRWPMSDAVRENRVVDGATRAAVAAAYPALAAVLAQCGLAGIVAVPAQHLGRVHGALLLAWRQPREFPPAERGPLRATAGRLARALVHARLYYAERAAHAAAEAARAAEALARREAELARADADRERATAVRANQAKDEFLAVVSHELRTPLQAVLGFSELMIAGLAGPLTAKQRDYVGRVQAAGGQLLDTIENLLGFARAQAGKETADAAPFDAAAVVAHVLAMAAPLAERKSLAIRHVGDCGPVPVVSDERKFRQIVTNLVANAVKFTPAGAVEAGVTLDGNVLRLSVRDTGVGIPAGQLERVFEPFTQADHAAGPTTRPVGGTGLGLSIVRSLAQLLGGDVRVESAVGRGSTFTVDLPRVLAAC